MMMMMMMMTITIFSVSKTSVRNQALQGGYCTKISLIVLCTSILLL